MSTTGSPTVVPTEWDGDSRRSSKNYDSPPSSATGAAPSEHGGGASHSGALPAPTTQTQLEGWPLLADLMCVNPGFEAFPVFESLNVRNLLYYQVELRGLEKTLRERELADITKKPHLHKTPERLIHGDSAQWDKVDKLRKCLREYNEALLQYAQVSALAHPSTHNMNELVKWMYDSDLGKREVKGIAKDSWGCYEEPKSTEDALSVPWLVIRPFTKPFTNLYKRVLQQDTYQGPYIANLVAPRGRKSTDGLSRWMVEDLIPSWAAIGKRCSAWYGRVFKGKSLEEMSRDKEDEKRRKGKDKDIDKRIGANTIQTIHETTILTMTTAASTLLACMIPVVAVWLLSIVEDLKHKLTMITCFTFMFGLSLMIVSEVTRVQVFMATSAFLAVLVVFIPVGGH